MWDLVMKAGLLALEMIVSDKAKREEQQLKWMNAVRKVNSRASESPELMERYEAMVRRQNERMATRK
jgi:hypothetical protein